MVEAAGVEPASENTSSQSTTCVSPFDCRGRLRTEPSAPSASPDLSHPRASRRNAGTSLLNDGQSQATGLLKLTAHWFLSSESVVCVRSYVVFPQDLRGRGPRHAFRDPAPPSKPSRPHGEKDRLARQSGNAATANGPSVAEPAYLDVTLVLWLQQTQPQIVDS